ncbi:MAG: type II secretion system protein GspG [Pirellulales bacterium]
MQFGIATLLVATAVCAVMFALPFGIYAAPFILATLAVYVYGVHTRKIEPSSLRILLAGTTSVLVVAIVHWVCWQEVALNAMLFDYQVHIADRELRHAREELAEYHREHGEYPASLNPLRNQMFARDANNVCLDPWQNPVHYRRTTAGYELSSYGRDGKPGGIGIESDLDGVSPIQPPTLNQYLYELDSGRKVSLAATLSGGAAFALYYWGSARPHGTVHSRPRLFLNLLATVAIASVIAVVLAILHAMPAGH